MKPNTLYKWVEEVSKQWQGVTDHFQENVAVFSRGVVLSASSHIKKISGVVGGNPNSQRRRLQRFLTCKFESCWFGEWTATVIEQLPVGEDLILIVDETKIENRFGAMVVGIAVEQRCIPVAWHIYKANDASAYPAEGQVEMILGLLRAVQAGIPAHYRVRVLADRGIGTSPTLMKGIMQLGWYFLFRVTKQSKIVLSSGEAVCFYDQVKQPGDQYAASGLVFKQRGHVPGHVRVLWREGSQEPWALVTNDPTLSGWCYARRNWIEQAFRDLKSHGWNLQQVQLQCPQRLQHLWIVLVVAYTWMLLMGIQQERGQTLALRKRRWSLFRQGRMAFLASMHPT